MLLVKDFKHSMLILIHLERIAKGQHSENTNTEAIDVNFRTIFITFTANYLWRHIIRRPSYRPVLGLICIFANPKVAYFDLVIIKQKDVLKLYVSMDNPFIVNILKHQSQLVYPLKYKFFFDLCFLTLVLINSIC